MSKDLSQDASVSPERLHTWCAQEYESSNPIKRALLGGFFRALEGIVRYLKPSDTILEVGCGAGESTLRLKTMLGRRAFEASDADERYVALLEGRGFPVRVTRESAYALQRPDDSFDCIFLLEVLEHLENPEQALHELCRVSRRDIVVSVPNEPLWRILNMSRGAYWADWGNTPGHINHWSARELRALVSKHATIKGLYTPLPWTIVYAEVRKT